MNEIVIEFKLHMTNFLSQFLFNSLGGNIDLDKNISFFSDF
jgi:hypothetical protein